MNGPAGGALDVAPSKPFTRWDAVASALGVHPETVRRARRRAGDKRRRSCWFADLAELQAWWRRVYCPEPSAPPARPGRTARRRAVDPLDVSALRRELAGGAR